MAGVEPKFVIYDGDPVQYILSVNVARRQLNAGQCAVLCALAYPEPRQRGRKSSIASKVETFVPKPEWFYRG